MNELERRTRQLYEQSSSMDPVNQEAFVANELRNDSVERHRKAWEERTGRKWVDPCEQSYLRSKRCGN
jgi:hypothetical protein